MDFVLQLLTGLAGASSLFLVAAGLTVIFGVTRVVNFSHGSLYMLGAYIGWSILTRVPRDPVWFVVGIVLTAVATGVVGVVIETVLLRRIYRAPELFQLLATFGVVLIVQDATLHLWGANDLALPRPRWLRATVEMGASRFCGVRPGDDRGGAVGAGAVVVAVHADAVGDAGAGRRRRIGRWCRRWGWISGGCSRACLRWGRGWRGWGERCRCRPGRRIWGSTWR